ncbi:universal stress protein [Cohnella thailandensis]|uniref:Universal stress protein n=1 Tax=Cohnella thailandensis TaxID=557557 RepID=A0A841SZL2_9BACL|nr:universal stress protein [Cohnella thailandensis]MBB6635270.1 universal stress protein [Cohnella thailandensis]MBP1974645.1 two-component system sensor histidine kinase KdpD [Cohnella thailandensis]
MDNFRRRTPEELLYSIYKIQKGRLKIYLGAVNGSGKTYHMLREGQALKKQGIDVVLCAVSTMQRPETVEQLEGLERIPSIHWTVGDTEKKDLNLEELVRRNPEVVLVDGLAHRNREGARFATRLEDIQFLLNEGISVITTVNVFELEGATEIARKLTRIDVEETVPADTLELADEVRLIDVTPETMLERISAGHMKTSNRSLYDRGNLGKLREIALRTVAEGVNESLERHREENGLLGPSGAAERILVSVQYHWNGSIYVRRGQQIAKRLGGDLRIVSFVRPGRKLTEEAAAFKRSIIQLAAKVEGQFEELPLANRRALASELVRYSARNNVTRIVMGHSKMGAWQEWRKGSVVNGLLRRIRNTDLFFVADRAEREGERILPTKSRKEKYSERYRRKTRIEVEEQIEKIRRGKFKVYIGAAPGVGKTYTMLREGNDLLKKGIDVVIGLLETHGRQETGAQIGSLQAIPKNVLQYRGTTLEEMDLDAIKARNPEVVLVDELAHTNVPGSTNAKRYEDVLELLNAGISVISTMNVQHLESLNDAVEQITGIRVRETVPDRMLRLADEVQLIDVAPASLQQRMAEGKIYAMDKVDQALNSFFKTGNLIALRELALREIADDVDERLESWERREALRGPWRRQETICVAVTLTSNAERLIRRGFRIAHRLKAAWYVTYVQLENQRSEEASRRLEKLQELTVRLGGKFEVLAAEHSKKIASTLIAKANEYGGTQIIAGQSARGFWYRFLRGDVVRTILRRARHMDVLVVADYGRMT